MTPYAQAQGNERAKKSFTFVERGYVLAMLHIEIARGFADVDRLTDKAWRLLRSDGDALLSTGELQAVRKSREWLVLRRTIVLPLVSATKSGIG